MDIRGYGANNEVLTVLEGTIDIDPARQAPRASDVTLSGPLGDARMHVETVDGTNISIPDDTFPDAAKAVLILARIQADIPQGASAMASTPLTHTSSVQIRGALIDHNCEIVQNCVSLVRQKVGKLADYLVTCTAIIHPSWGAELTQLAQDTCSKQLNGFAEAGGMDSAANEKCQNALSASFNKCGGSSGQ
jgi:hypothetical protein